MQPYDDLGSDLSKSTHVLLQVTSKAALPLSAVCKIGGRLTETITDPDEFQGWVPGRSMIDRYNCNQFKASGFPTLC